MRHRGVCCRCRCPCLWTTLLILILLLLLAGVVFYLIFLPHLPSFSVAYLRLSKHYITETSAISVFSVTVNALNPNRKVTFLYDRISVSILTGDARVGEGYFPAFINGKNNVTQLRTVISSSNVHFPDGSDVWTPESGLQSNNLSLKVLMETKAKIQMEKIEAENLKMRVTCNGINISIPTGQATALAATSDVKCKIDIRYIPFDWKKKTS